MACHAAIVNDWLQVGSSVSCLLEPISPRADWCIHISKEGNPRCDQDQVRCYERNLYFDYSEGQALSEIMLAQLDAWAEELHRLNSVVTKKTVLVHCGAGQTRSPSVAAYLLARTEHVDIWRAIADIGRAVWIDRRLPIDIRYEPYLKQVAELIG